MTNNTQCAVISIVDDNVLENSEEFLVQADSNSLVTPAPAIVIVTIVDDDRKSRIKQLPLEYS